MAEILRNKYILSHQMVSSDLLAGTAFPPAQWMNEQLKELGEKWLFAEPSVAMRTAETPVGKSLASMRSSEARARLQFQFYSDDPDAAPQQISVPVHDLRVSLDISVKSVGDVAAKNGFIWYRICRACEWATEPAGFSAPVSETPFDREKHFVELPPNVALEKSTLEIMPPLFPKVAKFSIAAYYSCDDCPPIDFKKPQLLEVDIQPDSLVNAK